MDKEYSKKELEEILVSKLREIGVSERGIEYWLKHPAEMAGYLEEVLEAKEKEKES